MKTVTVLFGLAGTVRWILFFTAAHLLVAPLLLIELGFIAIIGFGVGFILLGAANLLIVRDGNPEAGLKALPLFHLAMAVYVSSVIIDYAF